MIQDIDTRPESANSMIYPWQQPVWKMLTQRFPDIGHGLLFYGKQGCGKDAFVEHFVAWLLCLNKQTHGACGQCGSCQWLKSDTHPNYVSISTDEDNKKANAQIKIEKIRELLPFVQQTVDGWRVIVIQPAEALNIASANALLKTLEEPGERVVIILVAEHFLKLPATIRSRLQRYPLDRIELDQATDYLQQQLTSLNVQQIQLYLNLANGMPLQAISLLEQAWISRRQEFMQDWLNLVQQKSSPIRYATKWAKELNFAELQHLLEYLLSDLICVKLKQSVKNIDLDFTQLCDFYSLEALFDIYAELQQSKIMIQQNVQTNLVIDQMFVLLMNANRNQ
ncbi:DNA polymerase III, delta' subunit [Acinetobacter sp. ANC 3789]|uniref:DNA polymerase III, delta' subunit n=1 Tax=Acinetobacter sp. ANC 3789 TaxID=1217714 RepID=UPI0002CFCD8D|nr:DNA polymerase III, delta' subunit [Acinetobacter sp. ANC 3789]ENU79978.1 DNA polymerase III, delta' subunit [Acinetobacter sp. ANC 3789]